ncbi:MAG: PEGA domain-containing protein [Deltaproteobacteria bacterium]|nr:PEGA domain-containing protein [Deltaproteobacteria bacterium]
MKSVRRPTIDEATLINIENDSDKSNKNLIRGSEAYPLLEIQSGPKQGAWFTLSQQKEITIGRAGVNSIVLEDNSVSRSHTVLHEMGGKFFIKDVGSRNGTYVNEQRVQEDFQLKHKDKIRIGIYNLVFLTEAEEIDEDDFFEDEKSESDRDSTLLNEVSDIIQVSNEPPVEVPPESSPSSVSEHLLLPIAKNENSRMKTVIFSLSLLFLFVGLAYTAYRFHLKKKIPFVPKEDVVVQVPKIEDTPKNTPQVTPESQVNQYVLPPESQPTQTTVVTAPENTASSGSPVFLDVDAKPLAAKIFYQGKELGSTPFKINVNVPLGVPQELVAVYHFQELGQDFSEKKTFTVSKQDEIVNLRFEGTVGSLNVKSLPKDCSVYLEASFASNELKTQSVKLQEIVYTRPISLPYGNYKLEIKRPTRLEGSETIMDVVSYYREFVISAQNTSYEVSLSEQDFKVFPAKIITNPPGAEVWVESKKYGVTPFDGKLPLVKGTFVLKKEGYYDHEQSIPLTMNTPFAVELSLKTSEAGQFINKGKELISQGQYAQAVDQLSEALKHNPSAFELADINYHLGLSYIQTKTFDVAQTYLEKAKASSPQFKSKADLAIAEALLGAGNSAQALNITVDLILNEKDEKLKSDAETLFHKISGLKSVFLVSTTPPGAKVTVNGQEIGQASPVLLSDIPLGVYHVLVEKPGFKKYETRFEMSVSTFKPILIKLEPLH